MHQWDHRRLLGAAAAACLLVMWHSADGAPAHKSAAPAAAAPPVATPPVAAPAAAAPAPGAPPATPAGPAAAASASPMTPPMTPPMTAAQVIQVLDQTVDWYRTLGIQTQAANEPSDLLILYDNRQTAGKIMSLAFDIARADADILGKMPAAAQQAAPDGAVSSQTLQQLKAKLDAQNVSVQGELMTQRERLTSAVGKTRVEVQAKINELQGELDLVNTKRTILDTMAGFSSGGGDGSGAAALKAQIDAMAVAIPAANASTAAPAPAGSAAPAASATATAPAAASLSLTSAPPTLGRFGLWDLASNAFKLSEKSGTISSVDQRTADLQATVAQIRAPLIEQIKTLSARGDTLAAQADSADSATLNDVRAQLDGLADQFKQSSALLIPLSREGILLSQYRRNLGNWRDAVKMQSRDALKTLGVRVAILAVVLVILFAGAELWRRAAVRYIQDSRRRYQLLLLRRIALWSMIVVVVGIAFASELGSIVTFAGLITAGIAVAMQSVLVSIVGYFFLIGKYGIRVGDRVQIGEVAGEVIDLGLVRMYLMELGAKGALGPTGRVVAFANSVVFQVSSGLFKQIPGVNFTWREITLILPAGADYAALKEKLQRAMLGALEEYRPEFLRQTREIQRTTSSSYGVDAQPQVQLTFSGTSVEAHIRYPVHLQHAAEIDERVTQALAKVLGETH